MNRPFSGIIPPLVTPLADCDRLDHTGLKRLVEHLIGGGVDGIFVLGTTGEGPSLSHRLRREMIAETTRLVAGRVPVLAGITDTSFVETVELAQAAAEAGATAVVLSTPYYFTASQAELAHYVTRVVQEISLPLMLYNIPSLTKLWFELETLKQLAANPRIIGIKDSSGDLDYFASLIQLRGLRPDWSIMIGPEHLLPEAISLGGDGGVPGGANVLPRLFVACYDAAVANDLSQLAKVRHAIQEFQQVYSFDTNGARYIKPLKCCLSLLHICDDFMAEPFHRFSTAERDRLHRWFGEMATAVL